MRRLCARPDLAAWLTWLGLAVALLTGPVAAAPAATTRATPLEEALQWYQRGELGPAEQAFERLAVMGVPAAQYNLAVMHLRREAAAPSTAQAVLWMARAAERGFVTAMVGLAQLYERGDADGQRNLPEAHRWMLRAAEAGSPEAQVEAATGFYLGRGTAKDPAAAAHWYREAAKRGDVGAQYLIASMYEQGLGLSRDLRLALYWYERAAAGGDVAAPGKAREMQRRLHEAAGN